MAGDANCAASTAAPSCERSGVFAAKQRGGDAYYALLLLTLVERQQL